jgi:hypothetical protein
MVVLYFQDDLYFLEKQCLIEYQVQNGGGGMAELVSTPVIRDWGLKLGSSEKLFFSKNLFYKNLKSPCHFELQSSRRINPNFEISPMSTCLLACWSFTRVLWLKLIQTQTPAQTSILDSSRIFYEDGPTAICHFSDIMWTQAETIWGGKLHWNQNFHSWFSLLFNNISMIMLTFCIHHL